MSRSLLGQGVGQAFWVEGRAEKSSEGVRWGGWGGCLRRWHWTGSPRLTLKEGQDRRGGPGKGHGSLLSEKNLDWALGDMAV